MKMQRPTSDHERDQLKRITQRAIAMAGGPASFALVTRVPSSSLSKYAAMHEVASFIPLDVASDLQKDIGAPVIAEALAAPMGFKCVPANTATPQPLGYQDIRQLNREAFELSESVSSALEDGVIDVHERREILDACEELIAVVRAIQAKVGAAAPTDGDA